MRVKMTIICKLATGKETKIERAGDYGDLKRWQNVYEEHFLKGEFLELSVKIERG